MEIGKYMVVPGFFAVVVFIFLYRHFIEKEASIPRAVVDSFLSAVVTFIVLLVVIVFRETILKR